VSGATSPLTGAAVCFSPEAPDILEDAYDFTDIASFKSPVLLSHFTAP
jgi:hypothetical protein